MCFAGRDRTKGLIGMRKYGGVRASTTAWSAGVRSIAVVLMEVRTGVPLAPKGAPRPQVTGAGDRDAYLVV
ncbi:hypothetical protein [Novacetimonas pomaceti]|uniref:Uncharacterized protein n=1 Tax=Novacetimonas pomaceti TaxID=2021998 RepID=A0A318QCY7_9PROT|nr:hypothetical protein [Novacetimonas pomaceti]PYD75694.1 hypothetical protein CFR71_07770 [Novacetimonas pomaceti]